MDPESEERSILCQLRSEQAHSPYHDNVTDDEDAEKELEVLLYSQVHHETAIAVTDSTHPQQTSVHLDGSIDEVNHDVLSIKRPMVREVSVATSNVNFKPNCRRSEFNKVGRTKASRYYDIHENEQGIAPPFITPIIPSKGFSSSSMRNLKSSSAVLTAHLVQRFSPYSKEGAANIRFSQEQNERKKNYAPSEGKTTSPAVTTTISEDISHSPKSSEISNRSDHNDLLGANQSDLNKELVSAETLISSGKVNILSSLKKVEENSMSNIARNDKQVEKQFARKQEDPNAIHTSNNQLNKKQVAREHEDPTAVNARNNQQNEKQGARKQGDPATNPLGNNQHSKEQAARDQEDPNAIHARNNQQNEKHLARKQPQFDARISQVVSSMLDDESSSVDDHHLVTTKASQAAKSSLQESGWSVGMSWYDMSSSHFEVESVDSESLCSFPAQENSTVSDSCANTNDAYVEKESPNDFNTAFPGRTEHGDEPLDSSELSRYDLQLKHGNLQQSKDLSAQGDPDSEEDSVIEMHPPLKPVPALVELSDEEHDEQYVSGKVQSPKSGSEDDIVFLCSQKKLEDARMVEIVVSDDDISCIEVNRKKIPLNQSLRASSGADSSVLWLSNPVKAFEHLDHQRLLDKMHDDPKLWKLCAQDLSWSKVSVRGAKCKNCNLFGHKTNYCNEPRKPVKCHMCGNAGHKEFRCPWKMCLRCGKPNNVYTDRCKSCSSRTIKCKICRSVEHEWKTCPDMWRRYHLTTTPGSIIRLDGDQQCPLNLRWCSNCAKKGHLSHECQRVRWKCDFISPFVESYLTPAEEELRITNKPTTATILLTEEDSKLLKTMEGVKFLGGLSSKKHVSIRPMMGSLLKSINITGSLIDQEETRVKLMKWLAPKRQVPIGRKKVLKKSSTICNSSDSKGDETNVEVTTITHPHQDEPDKASKSMQSKEQRIVEVTSQQQVSDLPQQITDNTQLVMTYSAENTIHNHKREASSQSTHTQHEPQVARDNLKSLLSVKKWVQKSVLIPEDRVGLIKFINQKLSFAGQIKIENIQKDYAQIVQLSKKSALTKRQISQLQMLHLKVNVGLLGKCKNGPGRSHLDALWGILKELKSSKTDSSLKNFKLQTAEHYVPLFEAYPRSDLTELMEEYFGKQRQRTKPFKRKVDPNSKSQFENPKK